MKIKVPMENGLISVYSYDDEGNLIGHEITKQKDTLKDDN